MDEFTAFLRFAWWSFRVNLCDWLPGTHARWCDIHQQAPEVWDERWWDVFGWRQAK